MCLSVLAISCWVLLDKFRIGELGAELPAMTSRHRHICNPIRVCANAIWNEITLPCGLICDSSIQQYPISRPESSESVFSFRLSGLCLYTWHATCCAIINLAPPIAALHQGKTAGSGEMCLKSQWLKYWLMALCYLVSSSSVCRCHPPLRLLNMDSACWLWKRKKKKKKKESRLLKPCVWGNFSA